MRVHKVVESCLNRLNILKEKTRINEFSGKPFNSMKSIIIQIEQTELLTPKSKVEIILDILNKIEEKIK